MPRTFVSPVRSSILVCPLVLRQRRLPAAESPVFLERRGHQPIADGHLDDALAEEGEVQAAESLQEVDDLRYAAFGQGQSCGGVKPLRPRCTVITSLSVKTISAPHRGCQKRTAST